MPVALRYLTSNVKEVGKTAARGSIKAILMQRHDHSGRLPRVWISFHGQQPTAEEQKLVWPSITGTMRKAVLWDRKENRWYHVPARFHGPRYFNFMKCRPAVPEGINQGVFIQR